MTVKNPGKKKRERLRRNLMPHHKTYKQEMEKQANRDKKAVQYLNTIRENIIYRRKSLKITQDLLAERSGIHTVTLSKYERGKASPNIFQLIRLCVGLGVSLEYIIKDHKRWD
jgi:DNA-binding XRE family transcriptional regulator